LLKTQTTQVTRGVWLYVIHIYLFVICDKVTESYSIYAKLK